MKKIHILSILLILVSFIIGWFFYPKMPDMMASHWGINGEVNGYISKFWGIYLIPIIMVVIFAMMKFFPKMDPLRKNIEKFEKYYDIFILIFIIFMTYLYALTLIWNLGKTFDMNRVLAPAFGIFYYYTGIMISKSKKNWFIGIRTPWTLSSDVVWDKTHKLGGTLFKISGMSSLFGIFFPKFFFLLLLIPILISATTTIIYSYFIFIREREKNKILF